MTKVITTTETIPAKGSRIKGRHRMRLKNSTPIASHTWTDNTVYTGTVRYAKIFLQTNYITL